MPFFTGGHERHADGVRHHEIPEAQRHVRNRAGHRTVGIPADVAQHAGPKRVHDRRRVQPARFGGVRHTGHLHRYRRHCVLRRRRMGIFRVVLFRLHIHVDHRIRRFRAPGKRPWRTSRAGPALDATGA